MAIACKRHNAYECPYCPGYRGKPRDPEKERRLVAHDAVAILGAVDSKLGS